MSEQNTNMFVEMYLVSGPFFILTYTLDVRYVQYIGTSVASIGSSYGFRAKIYYL